MKDLDFDELDQAVSSVLGSDKQESPAVATAPTTTAPVPATSPEPKVTEPTVVPTPAAPAAAASEPVKISPAVKRRGQFLDMVHPSADMTSRSAVVPTARKKITPVSSNVAPSASTSAPEPAAPTSEPTLAPAPAIEQPTTPDPAPEVPADDTPKSDSVAWPDPLDLDSSTPTTEQTDQDEPAADAAEPAAEVAEPVEAPATTPFVTDAKVDKRPLGAFATEEAPEPAAEAPVLSLDDTKTTDPAADEQKVPDVTPPELQPDVVSVEAAADREFAPEKPANWKTPDSEPDQKKASDPEKTDTKPDEKNGMTQSIPQQYRAPAKGPDQAQHPVFDTKEYHQPLLPSPHKRKVKGGLIVMIIVLLLIAGAALGYFAFMAGL